MGGGSFDGSVNRWTISE